jgi:predicted NBD/HSP70 family sugar kinase
LKDALNAAIAAGDPAAMAALTAQVQQLTVALAAATAAAKP